MAVAIEKGRRSAWLDLAVLAGYLLLTLLVTWPAASHFSSELAGSGTDLWIHQWTFWWVKNALSSGQSPFYTTLLYYPDGVSLASHNIAWFNIALWLPLQALMGATAAYNTVFLLVFTLNCFAFYLLAKAETKMALAAVLGGLIFGFWPYTLSHNDHPNMMVVFWVPLTMLFMLKTFRQHRIRDALLTGVCLALIGITRWQLLVMSAPILIAYGLYLFYREADFPARRTAVLLLIALGLSALLMAPLGLPPIMEQLASSDGQAFAIDEPDDGVTDLLAYIMPPDLYRAIAEDFPDLPGKDRYHRIAASSYYVPYIGLVTLALVLVGLWRRWPSTWFWLLLALGIMILALGPELAVNGRRFPAVPLPYRAISESVLDALIRRPHRFNVFLGLPLAMIATWGMVDITERILGRWGSERGANYAALTALLIGALILWDNPVRPLSTTRTEVPDWYRSLAEEEGSFAILELPFYDRGFDKLYMYNQTFHNKPILTGHVSRLPLDAFSFLDSIPFLEPYRSVNTWTIGEEQWRKLVDFEQVDVTRQFDLLAAENVRYIVFDRDYVFDDYLNLWRNWVVFDAAYEDEELVVYRTDPQEGEEFDITFPLADGIGLIHAWLAPQEANQAGVVTATLHWASGAAPAADYQACFYLVNEAGQVAGTLCDLPVDSWPTSQWGANAVARGEQVIPLAADLPPGRYSVAAALANPGDQTPVGELATLGEINVAPFDPVQRTLSCWEGDLCLRGYELEKNAGQLDLALYWQSPAPAAESHKRFVHLIDLADGRLVAQVDSVPREWTYPTTMWEPGEVVADKVSLSLEDAAPGSYAVRVGWYTVEGEQPLYYCPTGSCQDETAESLLLATITLAGDGGLLQTGSGSP